jgi:hypothetical protein
VKHWKLDEAMPRAVPVRARPRAHSWPRGATAGVALVALCCVSLGVLLYQLAGPRDVFAS